MWVQIQEVSRQSEVNPQKLFLIAPGRLGYLFRMFCLGCRFFRPIPDLGSQNFYRVPPPAPGHRRSRAHLCFLDLLVSAGEGNVAERQVVRGRNGKGKTY